MDEKHRLQERARYMREWLKKPGNSDKNRARANLWNAANPTRKRANNLKAKYGLTVDEYINLLHKQQFVCAICRSDNPGAKGWCVDHCHTTTKVRGILCQNCNFVLGHAKDDPLRLRLAADYLERSY